MTGPYALRPYREADEQGRVRCRVLAFLGSACFDHVRREKERYDRPSIQLVAELDGEIVGLVDVECELEPAQPVHAGARVRRLRAPLPTAVIALPTAASSDYSSNDASGWLSRRNSPKSGTVKSTRPRRGLQTRPFAISESRCTETPRWSLAPYARATSPER